MNSKQSGGGSRVPSNDLLGGATVRLYKPENQEERLFAAVNSTDADIIPDDATGRIVVTGKGYNGRRIYLGEFCESLLYLAHAEHPRSAIERIRFGPHRKTPNTEAERRGEAASGSSAMLEGNPNG